MRHAGLRFAFVCWSLAFDSLYAPPLWLRSGHLNTVYSFLRPRRAVLSPAQDERLTVAPGVRLLLRCHWQPRPAPCLLLVHGLEGDSEAGYMQTMAAKALRRGWHAIRLNVRGCGASEPDSATLYNSGLSGDLAQAAAWAGAQPRVASLALCGFSMGGNTVLKYAGELGAGQWPTVPALAACAAVSACLDLAPSADALHRRPCWPYERRFLWHLRRRVRRWQARTAAAPQWTRRRYRSIRDFDDQVVAPLFGYRDAADYYFRASAARVLAHVRVPTFILHAEDDPFIVVTPESRALAAANPAVRFVATRYGGHCAFMNPRHPGDPDPYWAENRVLDFCAGVFGPARGAAVPGADFMGPYNV